MQLLASPESRAQRKRLLQAYHALGQPEKSVLQFLSVLYEPIYRYKLAEALATAKIHNVNGQPFGEHDCKKTLSLLKKSGLLDASDSYQPRCLELIAEPVTRDTIREGKFPALVAAAEKVSPIEHVFKYSYGQFRSADQGIRALRQYLYLQDVEKFWKSLGLLPKNYGSTSFGVEVLLRICADPFDPDWFKTLRAELAGPILAAVLTESSDRLLSISGPMRFLEENWAKAESADQRESYGSLLTIQLIFRGRLEEAQALVEGMQGSCSSEALGLLAFLRGEFGEALQCYERAMARQRVATGKRKVTLSGHDSIFYALALIRSGDAGQLKEAHDYLKRAVRAKSAYATACNALIELIESQLGIPAPEPFSRSYYLPHSGQPVLCALTRALTHFWMDVRIEEPSRKELTSLQDQAVKNGHQWFAAEAAALLARLDKSGQPYARQAAEFHKRLGIPALLDLVRRREAWERSLEALLHVAETSTVAQDTADCRLEWAIEMVDEYCNISAREVKRLKSGQWSKGKVVSLRRLSTDREKFPYLTPKDLEVCSHIAPEYDDYNYYGSRLYFDLAPKALLALAGHPHVFWRNGGRVEVIKGEPELLVTQKGAHVTIKLFPEIDPENEVAAVKETASRLKVVEFSPAHRRIASVLQKGLKVPADQKERILEALGRIAGLVTIHSDIGGGLENVPEVPADPRPRVVLSPAGLGLRVQVHVRPLAQGGPYYLPGAGGATVVAEVDGQRVQTCRDLALEKDLAGKTIAACTVLERAVELDGEWCLEDPEECLEFLDELHGLGDAVLAEWPQGEKMRIGGRAALGNFHVKVGENRNWFEASGELRLDEDRVLTMRQLLELLEQAPGRFVPLGDGQFLSLTKEFRKRLDELSAMSEAHGKGVRFHTLAAPVADALFEGAGSVKTDQTWKTHLERFREAQVFEPEIPSTLRATLRDYQVEGYQWLARLSRWGAGACLADDMGLGKTVQALAVLLAHAAEGPALVVAPTSVCMNWLDEVRRFAPTLSAVQFGPGDRKAMLAALKPFDLLVCSYGLLYQEEEMLTATHWRVAILDEAQAIKNVATRRSQAAMNLQADFRLITTGTPIENHLGELWNLFRFINPGLLGSLEQFNQRFAVPIEKRREREARVRLKKVIQPFILRRVKEQVLEELPSRTEILLHVEFNQEEVVFYEALRRKALEKIAQAKGPANQQRLQILAEIMRLRRACCNAQLVAPDAGVSSSKLAVFLDLVEELIENRHKALVFSQFVDHLSILRRELDARKIAYQYLDGATPQRARKKNVDAFQAGEGDLFLISLKAGGLGLNLTAADYVIHMDPWWNPAVEDQASDRAHRIGQQRPVTIYRLVTKDTIESKIVELHAHKRDLADSLLEGSDMTGKMSADELLGLLQQGL